MTFGARQLSDDEIDTAKKLYRGSPNTPPDFTHPDAIRAAYQWLDAQLKDEARGAPIEGLSDLIREWAERWVSPDDVRLAAFLHPDVKGKYSGFNIHKDLVEPHLCRIGSLPPYENDVFQDAGDKRGAYHLQEALREVGGELMLVVEGKENDSRSRKDAPG